MWHDWRVKKHITWSDRPFLNERVLFENVSRGGALGELTGMAHNWQISVRSKLVLMLDNAWAASEHDAGYPSTKRAAAVHRQPASRPPLRQHRLLR